MSQEALESFFKIYQKYPKQKVAMLRNSEKIATTKTKDKMYWILMSLAWKQSLNSNTSFITVCVFSCIYDV